jgi:hypothetical protein
MKRLRRNLYVKEERISTLKILTLRKNKFSTQIKKIYSSSKLIFKVESLGLS